VSGYQHVTCTIGQTTVAGLAVWADPEPTAMTITLDQPVPVLGEGAAIELTDESRRAIYVLRADTVRLDLTANKTRFVGHIIEVRPIPE
jgi:hypothetical protein